MLIGDHEVIRCPGPEAYCCTRHPISTLPIPTQMGQAPSGNGSWLYPNGSYVLPVEANVDHSYSITGLVGEVVLHRDGSQTAEGLWRCEVPNENGIGLNTVRVIGFYHQGGGECTCHS